MVSIGAVTIRPVFATFTVILFVAMFWLAIHFSIWTMITVWLVMTIRLVSLMQW
jgi:type VI protein secretion system component VasF